MWTHTGKFRSNQICYQWPKKSRLVLSIILKWTKLFKEGKECAVSFDRGINDIADETHLNKDVTAITTSTSRNCHGTSTANAKISDIYNIKPSVAKVSQASNRAKRKISYLEVNARRKGSRDIQLKRILHGGNANNNDVMVLGQPKIRTYGCCICHQSF